MLEKLTPEYNVHEKNKYKFLYLTKIIIPQALQNIDAYCYLIQKAS